MKSRKTTVSRSKKTPKIMANKNLKIEKKKEYNPFVTRTIKRETVGKVKCYLKAVIPNPKDAYGIRKADGLYYNKEGHNVTPAAYGAEMYEHDRVYFYEVGANDGSYRKCTTREDAERRFVQLVSSRKGKRKFDKVMAEIRIRFYTFECKCGHQQEFKVLRNLYGYQFSGKCDNCGRKMNHKNSKLVAV